MCADSEMTNRIRILARRLARLNPEVILDVSRWNVIHELCESLERLRNNGVAFSLQLPIQLENGTRAIWVVPRSMYPKLLCMFETYDGFRSRMMKKAETEQDASGQ